MSRKSAFIGFLMLSLITFVGASLTQAANFNVDMGDMAAPCGGNGPNDIGFVDCDTNMSGGFNMIAVTGPIAVGDSVTWTMRSTPHTVTSEAALTGGPAAPCGTGDNFDSGVANAFTPGFVFTHTFTLGPCAYFCIIHPTTMQGRVDVGIDYFLSISVAKAGTGSGTVTGPGIDCGTTCSATFFSTSPFTVTLTATPAVGSVFAGWGGDCSGTSATCTVTLSTNPASVHAIATFNLMATTTTTTTRPTTTTTTSTTTTTTTTTTITTTSTATTTRPDCNDQNNGKDKDKGKGHDKGKCKGHDKDK